MANNIRPTLKRFWPGHLLVLLAVIVLVNLGLWQLRRLEQRRALNQEIRQGLNQPPTTLSGDAVNPAALHRHRVTVTGHFDNEAAVVLRNRSWQDQPGVELVVPLHISNSNQSVLVNRGWIPLENSTPATRRIYNVAGEVTIEGLAQHTQTRPNTYFAPTDPTLSPSQPRLDAWFRVDIDRIQQQLNYPLVPIFIEQSPANPPITEPPLRQETNDLGEGSHLGYAMQWFFFAIILLLLYGGFLWQQAKKQQAGVDA